jgi:glycosyltransferase involved in cell wall biosynthesis
MKAAILAQAARRMGHDADLTVTANNEAEFGIPNIQYIHYPTFLRPRPRDDMRWYHHPEIMLDVYYWIADRLMQMSHDRLIASRTLVNSDWTGERFVARHGGRTETLYPPIPTAFPHVPWEAREPGFVCVGRFTPYKRFELVVEIVAEVRRERPDAHVHLIGSPDADPAYYRALQRKMRALEWVTFHTDIPRPEVLRLIATHKYGVHAMESEHFGMAPAEMVCGGCLVWVHNSGGQVEVVGRDPRFTFETPHEAARKILALWDNPDEQRSARAELAEGRRRFSIDRFQARFAEIVREVSGKGGP